MRNDMSFLSGPPGRDGVGGVDPAVGVHDAAGNAIDNAVDGVADVLAWRHQQRRRDVDDERRFVVEAEDIAGRNTMKIIYYFLL